MEPLIALKNIQPTKASYAGGEAKNEGCWFEFPDMGYWATFPFLLPPVCDDASKSCKGQWVDIG